MSDIVRPITVEAGGTFHGFVRPGETDEEAKARIVFEAERRINEGHGGVRAHLSLPEEDEEYWERFEPCRAGDCGDCAGWKPGDSHDPRGVYCSCECHGSEEAE